jgi:hypothetical protein
MSYITCPMCGGGFPGYPCKCNTNAAPTPRPGWPTVPWYPERQNTGAPMAWKCPACGMIYAPHVDYCDCQCGARAEQGDETP